MDSEALIDKIYESSLLPEMWPKVLDDLASTAGARGGTLFAASSQILNWTSSHCLKEHMSYFVNSGIFGQTKRVQLLVSANHQGFMREVDVPAPPGYDRANDPVYRDVLWPAGLGWAAATFLKLPTKDLLVVTVEGEYARGPIDPGAVSVLDSLRPHIARSALLSARLQLERAKVAGETLALLGLPALVVDSAGKIVAANSLSETLDSYIRWRAHERVALKDRSADLLLQQALSSLNYDAAGHVRSFATRHRDDKPGLVVHVVPIRGTARDLFARCAAIIVLTPVTMPEAPPVDLIRSLFDLTPAEARVASSLVAGDTPDQIAAKGQVSLNTVRTQIRGLLDKTGCRRQTDFVALVSKSWVRKPEG